MKGDLESDDDDLDSEGLESIDEAFNRVPVGRNEKKK